MKREPQRQLLIRIPERVYQTLKVRAYYEGQSMTALVRNAIEGHIKPVRKGEYESK